MFEISANDADPFDMVGYASEPGYQAVHGTNDESNLDSSLRRLVEFINELRISEVVELDPNRRRLALACITNFLMD